MVAWWNDGMVNLENLLRRLEDCPALTEQMLDPSPPRARIISTLKMAYSVKWVIS